MEPTLSDIAVLQDWDLQTGFSFFPLLQRVRRPHGSMSFFHDDLPSGYLGHPNPLQLRGICHLLHTVPSSKTRFHRKEWSTHFDPFGFLKNEGEALIYWGLPTQLYNANSLLGLVAGLSVMFCGQGNSHLRWRADSGILTMNFLVFNRLKSKVHILLQICMNNLHWSYSCVSELS